MTHITELHQGARVRLKSKHGVHEGLLVLVSDNRRSLMVDLQGACMRIGQGIIFNFVPLRHDEKTGYYLCLLDDTEFITVEVLP